MATYPTDVYRLTYKDGRSEDVHLREGFIVDAPGAIQHFTGVDGQSRDYRHPAPETIARIEEVATGAIYPEAH